MKRFTVTAVATNKNASNKNKRFSIRTINKKEALKEAHKNFSSGAWGKGDYQIEKVEITK